MAGALLREPFSLLSSIYPTAISSSAAAAAAAAMRFNLDLSIKKLMFCVCIYFPIVYKYERQSVACVTTTTHPIFFSPLLGFFPSILLLLLLLIIIIHTHREAHYPVYNTVYFNCIRESLLQPSAGRTTIVRDVEKRDYYSLFYFLCSCYIVQLL